MRAAALETGADVPVCLSACARRMAGVGDHLGAPVRLPDLACVLVNPRRAVATRDVFAALGLERGSPHGSPAASPELGSAASLEALEAGGNDLEPPARKVLPLIGDILDRMKTLPGVRFARMSGSGATCFAIFAEPGAARRARDALAADHPDWWVAATTLR